MLRTFYGVLIALVVFLFSCGGGQKVRQAQSVVDSPDIHYQRGKDLFDRGNISDAQFEFEQAKSLDDKYAPAYEGLAQVSLEKGNLEEAKKYSDKSLDLDGKWVLARVVRARIKAGQGDSEGAIKEAKKAIKNVPDSSVPDKKRANVEAHLALGDIYRTAEMYQDAQSTFQQVLEIDRLNMKADKAIKELANYQSAIAGQRPELKKIASQKEVTRSDVAVLFALELPLEKIFREAPQGQAIGFRPPEENVMGSRDSQEEAENLPEDVPADHWAKSFIKEVLEKGAMETMPDGKFHPDDYVNRAEFARLMEKFMVRYWNDREMETKFFGTPSPFSDVNNTSPVFNAIMVVSTRNLIPGNDDGTFRPLDGVHGTDALNIIRKLKADL